MLTKKIGYVLVLVVSWTCWVYGEPGQGKDAAAQAQPLFNGKDFTGWVRFLPDANVDPDTVWQVKDGVIHCTGTPTGYLRTEQPYGDYRLELEWRWVEKPGNSGVLLHITGDDKVWPKSIEAQLKSDNAGDFYVIEGTDFKEHVNKDDRRVPKKAESNEKPIGEWNKMEIECKGDTIKVYVNGVLQNEATETSVAKGMIGLQSEGAPIEFRNIVLKTLPSSVRRVEK